MSEPTDCCAPGCTDEPGSATPRSFRATVASERSYALAEGPIWDEQRGRVLWVDINAGHVHSGSIDGSVIEPADQLSFDETVGAVVCATDGALLVAGQRDLYRAGRDSGRELLANVVAATKNSGSTMGHAIRPADSSSAASRSTPARATSVCGRSVRVGAWRSSTMT